MSKINTHLRDTLRHYRRSRGLSQEALSRRLGISRIRVTRLESLDPKTRRQALAGLDSRTAFSLADQLRWSSTELSQYKIATILSAELRSRRKAAGYDITDLEFLLSRRLTEDCLQAFEDGTFDEEQQKRLTLRLLLDLAGTLAWLPKDLKEADLTALPHTGVPAARRKRRLCRMKRHQSHMLQVRSRKPAWSGYRMLLAPQPTSNRTGH
ncbi:MAG: helix-turn-helix transcriptional regulator [Trueperaceae bacterium]